MQFIKKIISFYLAFFMIFNGICAKADTGNIKEQKSNNTSQITQSKIIKGISAVGLVTAGLIGGAWCWKRFFAPLPVLIIGGDKNAREALINNLKSKNSMNNSQYGKDSLSFCISKKTALGGNGVIGIGKQRATFENWAINECDASDPGAEKLVKDSNLIIAILTDKESTIAINKLIVKPELSTHMVVSVIDENYAVGHGKTLADEFAKDPTGRFFSSSAVSDIPRNDDMENGLLLNLGFHWNRKDDTFVCFRWST